MTNYNEKEIAYCSFYIIKRHKKITTKNLMLSLRNKMRPTGHDALMLKGRPDDLFSQKVRNLKSHDTMSKLELADYKNKYFLFRKNNKIDLFEKHNQIIKKKFKVLFLNQAT